MVVSLIALAAAQTFAVGTPAFDPRKLKTAIAGKPAQILVLGSPHLTQLPTKPDKALLEPLLDRLGAFKPDVITVEGISGEDCETLLRFKAQHGTAWDDYCWPTEDIEKATGLSVPAAATEIDRTLADWPAQPTAAQRRRLAMLFIAANERPSALVQWLRLPPAERQSKDGLNPAMVEILEKQARSLNENYAIGAALAARLGLERVYQTDDHLADTSDTDPAYGKAIQDAWNAKPASPFKAEYQRRSANVHDAGQLVALYRYLNDPKTQRAAIAGDMGRNALWPSDKLYGRQYLSWWENRNLRMAANIRGSFSRRPDARVLVIVGSTHKGYLDAYLDMMQDVRLVDAMQFLK
jgi:hypothetical protein